MLYDSELENFFIAPYLFFQQIVDLRIGYIKKLTYIYRSKYNCLSRSFKKTSPLSFSVDWRKCGLSNKYMEPLENYARSICAFLYL